jgi:hypothetical protein
MAARPRSSRRRDCKLEEQPGTETQERGLGYVQNYVQTPVRCAQRTLKIAFHYESKSLIPEKAGRDFRFTNWLLTGSNDVTQTRYLQS